MIDEQDEDEHPRGGGSAGGDDDPPDSEDIEILEVEAADEAGVRLPKARKPRAERAAPEIDLDMDGEEFETRGPVSAASSADLDAARAQVQELREQLMRTAADFDNFRKRVERDRVEERKLATAGLVRALLPVLDAFRWALAQAGKGEDEGLKGFREGMRLVEAQLFDILKSAGLEPVEVVGAFDPTIHEALMQETTTEVPHMDVLEVFEPGYRLGGRLLRPARVKVANNPGGVASGDGPGGGASGGGASGAGPGGESAGSESATTH